MRIDVIIVLKLTVWVVTACQLGGYQFNKSAWCCNLQDRIICKTTALKVVEEMSV